MKFNYIVDFFVDECRAARVVSFQLRSCDELPFEFLTIENHAKTQVSTFSCCFQPKIHSVQIRSNLNQYNFSNKFSIFRRCRFFFHRAFPGILVKTPSKRTIFSWKFQSCWKGIHRETWVFLFSWQKWMCKQKLDCMKNNRNSYRRVFAIIFQTMKKETQ